MPDDRPARARPVRVAARAPGVASPRRASGASRLAVATWGVIVVLGISGPPVHGPAPLVLAPAAAQRTVTGAPVAVPTAVSTAVPTTEPLPPPVPAPAAEMQPATFTSDLPDGRARIAIIAAMAQIGLPYVWGGNGPTAGDAGFDCSGLSTFAYAAAGVALPRTAHTQYYAGPHVPADAALQPGDLVFYGTPARVHHVGLYLGDGLMVNAPTFGRPVQAAYVRWSGDDYLGATRPAASGGPRSGFLPAVPPAPTPPREPASTDFVAPPAPPPAAVPPPEPAPPEIGQPTATEPAADPATVTPGLPSPQERVLAAPVESGTPTPGSPAALAEPSETATTPPPVPPTTTRPTTTQPTTTPPTTTVTAPASTPAQAQVPRTSPTAAPDPTTTPPTPVTPKPVDRSTTLAVGGTVADVAVVGGGADGLPRAAGIWARPGRPVLRLSAAPAVGSTVTITEPDGTAAGYTVRARTKATTAEAAQAVAAATAGRLVIVAPAGAGSWIVVTAA